jgi:hypothetical protein
MRDATLLRCQSSAISNTLITARFVRAAFSLDSQELTAPVYDCCCALTYAVAAATTPSALLQPPEVLKDGRMSPAMDVYGEQNGNAAASLCRCMKPDALQMASRLMLYHATSRQSRGEQMRRQHCTLESHVPVASHRQHSLTLGTNGVYLACLLRSHLLLFEHVISVCCRSSADRSCPLLSLLACIV